MHWGSNSDWGIQSPEPTGEPGDRYEGWLRRPYHMWREHYDSGRRCGLGSVIYWLQLSTLAPSSMSLLHWEHADSEIANIIAAGLEPVIKIVGAPVWATQGVRSLTPSWCYVHPTDPGCIEATAPTVDWRAIVGLCAAIAGRYRDRVRHFIIGNETNYPWDWPQRSIDALFGQYYLPAAAAIRAAHPEALLVGPESDDVGWLGGVLAHEDVLGVRLWDIISHHGYSWSLPYPDGALQRIEEFAEAAAPYRSGRPMWITETSPSPETYPTEEERAERMGMMVDAVEDGALPDQCERVYLYRLAQHGEAAKGSDVGMLGPAGEIFPVAAAIRDRLYRRRLLLNAEVVTEPLQPSYDMHREIPEGWTDNAVITRPQQHEPPEYLMYLARDAERRLRRGPLIRATTNSAGHVELPIPRDGRLLTVQGSGGWEAVVHSNSDPRVITWGYTGRREWPADLYPVTP